MSEESVKFYAACAIINAIVIAFNVFVVGYWFPTALGIAALVVLAIGMIIEAAESEIEDNEAD